MAATPLTLDRENAPYGMRSTAEVQIAPAQIDSAGHFIELPAGQVAALFGGMPKLTQARNELIRRLHQQAVG